MSSCRIGPDGYAVDAVPPAPGSLRYRLLADAFAINLAAEVRLVFPNPKTPAHILSNYAAVLLARRRPTERYNAHKAQNQAAESDGEKSLSALLRALHGPGKRTAATKTRLAPRPGRLTEVSAIPFEPEATP